MKKMLGILILVLISAVTVSAQGRRRGQERKMPPVSNPAVVHSNSPRSVDRDFGRDRAQDVRRARSIEQGKSKQSNIHSNAPGSRDRDFGRDRAEDVGRGKKLGLKKTRHTNIHSNAPGSTDRDMGRDRARDVGRGKKKGLKKH